MPFGQQSAAVRQSNIVLAAHAVALCAALMTGLAGCSGNETSKDDEKKPVATNSDPKRHESKRVTPEPPVAKQQTPPKAVPAKVQEFDVPEVIELPKVRLTEGDAETCLVEVGDTFPNGELTTLDGEQTELADHFGKNLTVICFLRAGDEYAVKPLWFFGPSLLKVHGADGLKVVDVHVGTTKESVAELIESTESQDQTHLLDPKGELLAKIANLKDDPKWDPRVFVVDASGKIVWFDIEFSRSTKRELDLVATALLGKDS